MLRYLHIHVLVLLGSSAFAQPAEVVRELHLTRITTDDGLPQGMVQDILQDQQGYLWFTTKDGLARSDGYGFTIFKHAVDDSTSIAGDHTNLLYQDSKGFIWIAVFGVGLDRYDPRTGLFGHVRFGPGTPRTAYNEIVRIREAPDGAIWFCAAGGHFSVVEANGTSLHATPAKKRYPGSAFPHRVNYFEFDADGALWAVNNDSLVCDPLGSSNSGSPVGFWPLPGAPVARSGIEVPHPLNSWQDGRELVLTLPGMILRFDARAREVVDTLPLPPGQLVFYTQLMDAQGYLWYRTDDERSHRVDLHTGQFESLQLKVDDRDVYEEFGTVFIRCQDNNGNIWGGTKGFGVLKLSRNSSSFHISPPRQTTCYYVDEYTVLGHKQFAMTRHPLTPDAEKTGDGIIPNGFATPAFSKQWEGAAKDPQGRIWGVLTDGVRSPPELCYVDRAGHLHRTELLPGPDHPNRVFHGTDGEVWVSTSAAGGVWNVRDGLVRINTREERIIGKYHFPVEFLLSKYWPIAQWSVAPDGMIWMATIDGLLALEPESGEWKTFRHDPQDSTSLPANMLFSICPDPVEPAHFLWVGTEGAGMAKLDKRSGKCLRVDSKKGLPNDVVYSILPDPAGMLWIGTNVGLCRYDPGTGKAYTYTKADGIAGNEFNRYGSLILPDGTFFFDGMDGGTAFHPNDLETGGRASPTVITGIRFADRSVAMHEFLVPGATKETYAMTIPHNESIVTFTYAVMDHTEPKRNTFRYRLDGFTKDWIDGGNRNEATFTNLDPGTYTFLVQGTNKAGVRDVQGANLTLTITPPWERTWWFRTLLVLLFLGSVYGLYRFRLQQQLRVIAIREGIARDLHDEIGSTLSSVALYGAVARKRIKGLAPADRSVLEQISEGASAAIGSMNDIVWAVNTEKNASEHVTQRMQRFASDICDVKGIELEFQLEPAMATIEFDLAQRKNIYLIFKEAVHNAVKYAACSRIAVKLWAEGQHIMLTVSDTGNGFQLDGSAGGMGGNGIHNMHARAKALQAELTIESGTGTGTLVTLKFAK